MQGFKWESGHFVWSHSGYSVARTRQEVTGNSRVSMSIRVPNDEDLSPELRVREKRNARGKIICKT